MNFHFPLMPRMFMALQMEDRFPIIDILDQTPPIPENCQWAMFLRNHDELTLEMVTDEERDYMWRVYANDPTARINLGIRRRLAPLLANSRRKIELLNILLFSMPGTPVLYYGDEIGMGDNFYLGDRNGCRTPMQWSPDRNAGFSKANPQQLYLPITIDPEYHYEAINVENQQKNLSSLLWWTRRVIAMRKNFKAFSRGSLEFLYPGEHQGARVSPAARGRDDPGGGQSLAFLAGGGARSFALCRLRAHGGIQPELFSADQETPYVITLGPHSHYWFVLRLGDRRRRVASKERKIPMLDAAPDGGRAAGRRPARADRARSAAALHSQLPLVWRQGADDARHAHHRGDSHLGRAEARRSGSSKSIISTARPETYAVPVQIAKDDAARAVERAAPHAVIARLACRWRRDSARRHV